MNKPGDLLPKVPNPLKWPEYPDPLSPAEAIDTLVLDLKAGRENDKARIEELEKQLALSQERRRWLLGAVEKSYRKHASDDHTIGWSELCDHLCDTICNEVGSEVFSPWNDNRDDGESLLDFIDSLEGKISNEKR